MAMLVVAMAMVVVAMAMVVVAMAMVVVTAVVDGCLEFRSSNPRCIHCNNRTLRYLA